MLKHLILFPLLGLALLGQRVTLLPMKHAMHHEDLGQRSSHLLPPPALKYSTIVVATESKANVPSQLSYDGRRALVESVFADPVFCRSPPTRSNSHPIV